MTQKQMIEMVKQHFPKESDTEIRILLNIARDEFIRKSRCSIQEATSTCTDVLGALISGGGVHEVTEVRMVSPSDSLKSTEIPKVVIKGTKEEGAL